VQAAIANGAMSSTHRRRHQSRTSCGSCRRRSGPAARGTARPRMMA
jgi:hypothetical protein